MPMTPVMTALDVPEIGIVTWDSEGSEGGRFHSRRLHVPSDTSGLTILMTGRPEPTLVPAAEEVAALENGTSLELPASVQLQLGVMRARFTFLPTGATMADSLVLVSGATQLVVTLDPWTGDVLAR